MGSNTQFSSNYIKLRQLDVREREIRLNFQKAQEIVSDLRAIARDTRNVADGQLQGSLNRVEQSWRGENSQEFIRKGSQLKNDVHAMAGDVDKIANTIEQIATNLYNAEREAVRIARERLSS